MECNNSIFTALRAFWKVRNIENYCENVMEIININLKFLIYGSPQR